MYSPHFSRTVAILSVLIVAARSTCAGPIAFSQVLQTQDNYQQPARLRLWDSQFQGAAFELFRPQHPGTSSDQTPTKESQRPSTKVQTESLLSGVTVNQNASQKVSISDGEIEGTLCDCGAILIAAGGIPKWPFLFLAGIPFIFINRGSETTPPVPPRPPIPTPTQFTAPPPSPTPPPVPSEVPEPHSLLLLLSGLTVIGLKRRRRKLRSDVTNGSKN